ncbi:ionotropic receptor 75a-like [Chrysoperla carnea]|uniref:ionotropic receptor 75a-like n=1 Tax=Chrysoperla carnea TaxID=189513 RepID=UPI001D06BE30|nr:ionotropic receptor 75a-like [Chrysoperla carnea]
MKIDFHHIGIVLDMQCPWAKSVLKNASDNERFDKEYHWLVFREQNSTKNFLHDLNMPINSDLLMIQPQIFTNQWVLHEIYNPGIYHGGSLKYLYYGTWCSENGFKIHVNDNLYIRRQNTGGLDLRAGVVIRSKLFVPVIDYLQNKGQIKFDAYTRSHHQIVKNVGETYNLRFKYIRVEDWVHGIVENLVAKKLDIGNSGVFIDPERVSMTSISPFGLFPYRIVFLFRHPKPSTGGLSDTFLRPLTYSVWGLSMISAFVIIVLLKITVFTETRKLIKKSESENTWSMATFVTFGAILQQGIESTPRLFSGRVIVYILLLFSVLLYQFYSASIVSSLLMEPPKTIKTLKDLLDSSLEVGINNEPYIISWYKNIKSPTEIQLYEKKIMRENKYPPHMYPLLTGLSKVKKGGFAYECMAEFASGYISVNLGWSEREICDLTQIQMRPEQRLYFISQKKSPFKKLFHVGILMQVERGIAKQETTKWLREISPCTLDSLSSSTFSVNFDDIASAFLVLAVGIIYELLSPIGGVTTPSYQLLITGRGNRPTSDNNSQ